jgi:hypothetical protein
MGREGEDWQCRVVRLELAYLRLRRCPQAAAVRARPLATPFNQLDIASLVAGTAMNAVAARSNFIRCLDFHENPVRQRTGFQW